MNFEGRGVRIESRLPFKIFSILPVEFVEAASAAVKVAAVVWLAARTVLVEAGRLGVLWIVAWHTWPR